MRAPDADPAALAAPVTSKLRRRSLAVVACRLLPRPAALPLGDRYPLKAAALFAVIMALSIGLLRQHHPFAQFGAANQITTLRAMLVVLVAGLIGEPRDAGGRGGRGRSRASRSRCSTASTAGSRGAADRQPRSARGSTWRSMRC